jgi:hypothetical protein
MENLISMTDFIQLQKMSFRTDQKFRELVIRYANFLQQPLELWMFVACDKHNNVIENLDVDNIKYDINITEVEIDFNHELYCYDNLIYQQAKERCFFGGFKYGGINFNDNPIIIENINTAKQRTIHLDNFFYIEDLTTYNLKLTPAALIQFT